jgi:arylsulfatase A-like enzyme/thioredoxin-like negative regulator of GroEL
MTMRRPRSGWWLASVLLLAIPLVLLTRCGRQARPSVVLITLDTTRADHLGCYGDRQSHTPTLDSLAACGVRFADAVTPVPITTPAHTSILTGLNPARHGVRDNGNQALDAAVPLVQEPFRAAGYSTAAFVSAFVLERQFGLARGFEVYSDQLYNERLGLRTARAVGRWIERCDPKRPFFLWVHFYDPHWPYRPVEPYRSLDLPSPYAKEIAQVDDAVRRVLSSLRRRGLLARTLVVVAGDHGEMLGEHGEPEHGVFLYEAALRVPLIVCLPGGTPRVCDAPVSLIDIAPTLLEAAHLAPLAGAEGTSLMPLLRGKPRAARPAEYCETLYPENGFAHSRLYAMRGPRWKYIRAPQPELYDWVADPAEANNLMGALPDTARAFEKRLNRYLGSLPAAPTREHAMSEEDRARLESLGYVTGESAAAADSVALPDPKELTPQLGIWIAAREALDEQRWADAVPGLREVLRVSPRNAIAARHLGEALQRLGRYHEAVAVLDSALRYTPSSVTLARHLAVALRRNGQPARAYELYRVVAADPIQHWMGVMGMAGSLLEQGRDAEAQALLGRETQGRPDAQDALRMAQKLSRYIELRQVRAAGPEGERVRLNLAGAAFDLGLVEQTRRALDFRSADPAIEGVRHRTLGSLAGAMGVPETAIAEFEQARERLPDDVYVQQHLAPLYLEVNRPREALRAALRATELGPPNAIDFYNLGCARARLGETDAALSALSRAIELGYHKAGKLLEDPDLAALQDDPRFITLAERAAKD